jgi:hypothetical protein
LRRFDEVMKDVVPMSTVSAPRCTDSLVVS